MGYEKLSQSVVDIITKFQSRSHFRRSLMKRIANRKSQKLSLFVKMAKYLSSALAPLNTQT